MKRCSNTCEYETSGEKQSEGAVTPTDEHKYVLPSVCQDQQKWVVLLPIRCILQQHLDTRVKQRSHHPGQQTSSAATAGKARIV